MVRVSIPRSPYDIFIGDGILERTSSLLIPKDPSSISIITDSNVAKKYGYKLAGQLSKITRTHVLQFPAGEKSKNLTTVETLLSKLSKVGVDRHGLIVALGGGVVGDLVGFVASIYKRGVAYVQIPTTLLAQVDSSIGGKTGVNTEWGKNQVGTFYEPSRVLVDPYVLETLPNREVMNGIAEMIKYGIIADRTLFLSLSKADFSSFYELRKFIPACCKIKATIVSKDEKEKNLRAVLNYGHTVGHAIEAASGYSISHGEAVAMGMLAEGWIAKKLGFFEEDDFEKQRAVFQSLKAAHKARKLPKSSLLRFAESDKKTGSGEIKMSLPEKIGVMYKDTKGGYLVSVPTKLFLDSINYIQDSITRDCQIRSMS